MKKRKHIFGLIHLLFFVIIMSGVFWMPWQYMTAIFVVLRMQDILLGGCVLTKWQFGSYKRRFTTIHLKTKVAQKLIQQRPIIIDWILPGILIVLAYFLQAKTH